MDAKTAKALAELGRAAARLAGVPDDVVITMTVCPDRDNIFRRAADTPDSPDSPDSAPEEDFFYARSNF